MRIFPFNPRNENSSFGLITTIAKIKTARVRCNAFIDSPGIGLPGKRTLLNVTTVRQKRSSRTMEHTGGSSVFSVELSPGYRAETRRADLTDIEQDEIIKNGLLCDLLKVLCQ